MIHIDSLEFKKSGDEQRIAIAFNSSDGVVQHGVWESGPDELHLNFEWHETVYVLDGKAIVKNKKTDETFTLVTGSMMTFEKGSQWEWWIPWKLRKVFTIVD